MSSNASTIAALQKIIADAQGALVALGVDASTTKMTKTTKTKPAADAEANPKQKGQMNAWTAYGKEVHATHAAEFAAWKAEQVAAGAAVSKQTVPCFISQWRKDHEAEYAAFEAAWKEAHPKGSAPASSAASVADDASVASEGSAKKRGPKKLAEMSAEERAAHDAKVVARRAAKAAKEGEAPAIAPVAEQQVKAAPAAEAAPVAEQQVKAAPAAEDEDGPELLTFKHREQKYLRMGTTTAEGVDWFSADLWVNKKGSKGDYVGTLQDNGSIDTDAEEPEF